jgi:hypothetical protein
VAEGVVIGLIGVAGEGAVDAAAPHVQGGVLDEVGVARVVQGSGGGLGQAELFVGLAEGQQAGIGGGLSGGGLDDDGGGEEIQGLLPGRL